MEMQLVYVGLGTVAQLVSLGIFIIILIKMFKNDSALKGIIGLLTCGLFTYVWGWMKHKQLALTKMMIVWTIMIFVPFALIPVGILDAVAKMSPVGLMGDAQPQKGKKISRIKNKKKANKKKRAGKSARAAKKKSGAKNKTPENVNWGDKALALWKQDKFSNPKQAKNLLDKEIARNPSAEVYNNRGNAYRELQQYKMALQDYNTALAKKPDFYKAYNNRGNVYFDQKNYQMAINDYNKAISLNPRYSYAWLNRGLAYYEMKNRGLACNDLKRANDLGDGQGWNWAVKNGICK
jgi:tetratricopeptide (TPR) repeat protein